MFEKYLRQAYQKILVDPLADLIINKISPNQVTLIACLSGITAAYILMKGHPYFACLLLLLSGYCDTLDGTLARHTKQAQSSSPFGAVLDIVCDRITEFAIIFGLFAIAPLQRGWLAMAMLGSVFICVTSFLIVAIFTENTSHKSFYYSPGIMERFEAFIFFIAMILAPTHFGLLAFVFIFLVILTSSIRLFQFYLRDSLI